MARPIPDDRLEDERRRMRRHQDRTMLRLRFWEWRMFFIGVAAAALIYVVIWIIRLRH